MKRAVVYAALALSLLLTGGQDGGRSTEQQATRRLHLRTVAAVSANQHRGGPCKIAWNLRPRGDAQVHDEIVRVTRRLFACAFERFYPQQKAKALDVLACESGWPWSHQHDTNPNKGAIQYQIPTFDHAYDTVIATNRRRSTWNLARRVYNARSQAIVTAIFVRRTSWDPWSCA